MPEMEVIKNKKNQGVQDVEIQIPAHAGEPLHDGRSRISCRVYPRARGGTQVDTGVNGTEGGLSPRTRGNLCLPSSCLLE